MPKTIKEISSDIGVSITTVRLVINGQATRYRISPTTRKLVEDYVATHGYVLHYAARSLKLKRTDTIGFVVPDLANPFFARLIAAIERHCRDHGLVLLSASTNDDPELETRTIDSFLSRGVDGLIITPCQLPAHRQLFSKKLKTAVVMVDRDYPQNRYPTVASDNVDGSCRLTRQMIADAGTPVDFLCAHTSLPSIRDRLRGFAAATAEHGRSDWQGFVHSAAEDSPASGRRLMRQLVEVRGSPPRAFMTSSLLVLEGAIQELKSAIGAIPGDLLIGTFDDHAMLDFMPNRVYSVMQDEDGLASSAFASVQEQMHGAQAKARHTAIPCRIVRRN